MLKVATNFIRRSRISVGIGRCNSNFFQRRFYHGDGEKSKMENQERLKMQGKELERGLLAGFQRTQLGRLLVDAATPNDLEIEYNNPHVVAKWTNLAAREGPDILSRIDNSNVRPVVVTVTGASGNIAYSLLPRIACGDMLGKHQPVILKLLEIPEMSAPLNGVKMELQDCSFPLLRDIVATTDPLEAFEDADYALLIGAKPRVKGQKRSDLLLENAKVFQEQGKALESMANSDVLVCVVGNPANTNALILSSHAPSLDPRQITALTRLDHDRGLNLISRMASCPISVIERFCIWGNHSNTQYPDVSNTLIRGTWFRHYFQPSEDKPDRKSVV